MRLNPDALEYVPTRINSGHRVSHSGDPVDGEGMPEGLLHDAPEEVLAAILAHVQSAEDLCSCLATCRALRAAVADAPVGVRVTAAQRAALGSPDNHHKLALLEAWVVKHCPNAAALDVSGLPLEDGQVARLLARLPRLQWLDLEGCKKLTPRATRLLLGLAGGGGGSSSGSGGGGGGARGGGGPAAVAGAAAAAAAEPGAAARLRFVNAQRCFQLTGASFDDLLGLARLPGSCLEGLAASHLTLEGGACGGGAAACAARVGTGCGCPGAAGAPPLLRPPQQLPQPPLNLRILVLTNSTLTAAAALALPGACPALEYLFLGGSTLRARLPEPPPAASADAGAAAQAELGSSPGAAAAPSAAAAAGPGGGGGGGGGSEPRSAEERLAWFEQRLGLPQELPPWACAADGCDPTSGRSHQSSGDAGAGRRRSLAASVQLLSPHAAAAARARGVALAAAAAALPQLCVLEVSFFDPVTQAWLGLALAAHAEHAGDAAAGGGGSSSSGAARPQVWDFCRTSSVAAAVRELSRAARTARSSAGGAAARARAPAPAPAPAPPGGALASALRAAANCSSRGRLTPLHVHAEAGAGAAVRALICRLGASVSAKDAHGQQPLFLACEAGHAAAAAALLRGCACATAMTKSGESPLYIASLKGHRGVVTLLLRHFVGAAIPWYSSQLYGDAFTPLMAAAVANRLDVAALLLQEAGTHARALASATNRYGQSAWHIAARKGCQQMMQLLATAAA
ncbi:MAG: hypothetical protein J3K34DRAFT_517997 [Monoraphidium minutum]|nr:MAG: hypothetical protein J3K34DRAFT_517997 [Monoraphidium minutum]